MFANLHDLMSLNSISKTARFRDRFNPFRKKSGLLNVLAKQSTRNRIGVVQGSKIMT